MLLKMKVDQKGSPNGIVVLSFEKGKTYDIDEGLAKVFLKEGWAELAKEEKAVEAAPDNKDAGPAPKNKNKNKKDDEPGEEQ
jgi:hypothetical protein